MKKTKCGVYKITNSINKEFYIGSSVNLSSRKAIHFSMLKNNKHFNSHLQNSVNKYGIDNFKFEIIEECEKFEVRTKEEKYIKELSPQYNKTSIVVQNYTNFIRSDTKEKLRNIWKDKNCWEHPQNKLNPNKVIEIIGKFNNDVSIEDIATEHDVTRNCILDILSGRKWKDFYNLVNIEKYKELKNIRKRYNILLLDSNRKIIKSYTDLYTVKTNFNISTNKLGNLLDSMSLFKKEFYFIRKAEFSKFMNRKQKALRRIKVTTNNEEIIFNSKTQAALHFNFSKSTFTNIVSGKKRINDFKVEEI